jgi:hypothetical protein
MEAARKNFVRVEQFSSWLHFVLLWLLPVAKWFTASVCDAVQKHHFWNFNPLNYVCGKSRLFVAQGNNILTLSE